MIQKYPCVCVVVHAHGRNDGGIAILEHMKEKYGRLGIYGDGYEIAQCATKKIARTFVFNEPYPANAASIAGLFGVPPQAVTHVLLIVDATQFEIDPTGIEVAHAAAVNGATGVAIGNLWAFDPQSYGALTVDRLGMKSNQLINYVEQYLRLRVVYLATSSNTVVDREMWPMHAQPDPTRIVRYGADDNA